MKKNKRFSTFFMQVKVNYNLKNDTLFDAFFVFNHQDLLSVYPEDWLQQNKTTKEELYRLIYPSQQNTQQSSYDYCRNFHVFAINGDNIPIYGVSCELFGFIIPLLLNLFKSNSKIDLTEIKSISFAFISKAPYFNTLFRLLELCTQISTGFLSLPDKEMYKLKYGSQLSVPMNSFISRLYNMDCNEFINFSKQNNFNMHHMLTGTVNSNGRRNFMFCASSFGHPGFDILFSFLTPKDIVTLYSALLLEEKIVVTGDNLFLITNVIMSFLFLISPFKPCVPFSPILPDTEHTRDLFGSPTPFISGFDGELPPLDEYTTVVDLNQRRVIRDITTIIPNSQKVIQELTDLVENENNMVPKNPKNRKEFWDEMKTDYLDVCEYEMNLDLKYCFKPLLIPKIQKILHEVVDFIFSATKLRACFESTNDSSKKKFSRQLFLKTYGNDENNEFCEAIVDTQCFNDYYKQIEDDLNIEQSQ